MTRRELEQEKNRKLAQISVGFGDQFSLQHGLVNGSDDMSSGTDQGSAGLIIPWGGCKHIKIMVGSE